MFCVPNSEKMTDIFATSVVLYNLLIIFKNVVGFFLNLKKNIASS